MGVVEYKVEEMGHGRRRSEQLEKPIDGGRMVDVYEESSGAEPITSEYGDEALEKEFELDEAEKEKRPALGIFTTDLAIAYDESSHKYPVTANRKLRPKSLVRVLNKSGRYVFNLGTVNLFEVLILNMFLVIYCY